MLIDFKNLQNFSDFMQSIQNDIGFKISSRGWAYILEQKRYINKDHFNKITLLINRCRKLGYLPVDFVAEESAREFENIQIPDKNHIIDDFGLWLEASYTAADKYIPDWWENEEYYIQMVVEKIDLVTLFKPICEIFKIPIANSRGWSSLMQRADFARRFAEAENKGKRCVLMYCGDFDPDGIRISEFLRKNLNDLKNITWSDGFTGYDPSNLIIDRFGLNLDFILEHKLVWIDNLITGSKKNLADPEHRNYKMPYVQEYLSKIGEKKCEGNAIITMPKIAQNFVRQEIEKYLGDDAEQRFKDKRQTVKDDLNAFLKETGSDQLMDHLLDNIKNR